MPERFLQSFAILLAGLFTAERQPAAGQAPGEREPAPGPEQDRPAGRKPPPAVIH